MKYNWMKINEFTLVYNHVKKNITRYDAGKNPELIKLFMDSFEEFFYQALKLKYVTTKNIKDVLIHLSRINKVGYLMEPFAGKDSYSYKNKTGIFINPKSSRDDQIFSIFKELARVSSSYDRNLTNSVAASYVSNQNDMKAGNEFKLLYLDLGFRLIEDGISLDTAENIYASYKDVSRKTKEFKQEKNIFGKGIGFLSNFKRMPSFQKLTILVGRKILNQSNKMSDDEVLYELSKCSLKEGFTKDFIASIMQVFGKEKMFDVIGKLGIIYKKEMDDTKSFFNINPYLRVTHAKKALKYIYSIMDSNKVSRLRKVS